MGYNGFVCNIIEIHEEKYIKERIFIESVEVGIISGKMYDGWNIFIKIFNRNFGNI